MLAGEDNLLGLKEVPKYMELVDYKGFSNTIMIVTNNSILVWNTQGVQKTKLKG